MKAFGVGGRFVLGLGKMIERYYPDGAKKAQMKSIKEVGLSLFAPELGGGYHVIHCRIMSYPSATAFTIFSFQTTGPVPVGKMAIFNDFFLPISIQVCQGLLAHDK